MTNYLIEKGVVIFPNCDVIDIVNKKTKYDVVYKKVKIQKSLMENI